MAAATATATAMTKAAATVMATEANNTTKMALRNLAWDTKNERYGEYKSCAKQIMVTMYK